MGDNIVRLVCSCNSILIYSKWFQYTEGWFPFISRGFGIHAVHLKGILLLLFSIHWSFWLLNWRQLTFGGILFDSYRSNFLLFLLQHIEDLTQEKFSLQRALEASRALAESLASENSALTDSYNQQVWTCHSRLRSQFLLLC